MKQPWKLLHLLLLVGALLAFSVFAQEEEESVSLSLVLDVIMITIGIISVHYAWSVLGGKVGQGLKIAAVGLAIFGLFHLMETLLFLFTNISVGTNEFIHRILGVVAFSFIAFGLYKIRLATKQESLVRVNVNWGKIKI